MIRSRATLTPGEVHCARLGLRSDTTSTIPAADKLALTLKPANLYLLIRRSSRESAANCKRTPAKVDVHGRTRGPIRRGPRALKKAVAKIPAAKTRTA